MFNNNAWDFISAGSFLNPNHPVASDGSRTLTLHEIINWTGGSHNIHSPTYGGSKSMLEPIKDNLQRNWFEMVMKTAALGFAFRFGKKIMRKPIATSNKMLRMAGLGEAVKV